MTSIFAFLSTHLGEAAAQNDLGNVYRERESVAKNDEMVVYWYKKAADQGFAKAQYNLGKMYEEGKGVTKDHKQAVYWYRKVADQEHEDAKEALKKLRAK